MCKYQMPDHISEEIFKWLPVKSLLKCRCVCKQWRQIIDSTAFLQEHLGAQSPCFIAECSESEFMVLDPRTLPKSKTLTGPVEGADVTFLLVGTLHGVVCLYDEASDILLWNPSLRKLMRLPLPETGTTSICGFDQFGRDILLGVGAINMDFDQLGHDFYATSLAFWIDPSTKDFKIIMFNLIPDEDNAEDGIVYSSIQQSWSVLPLDDVRKHSCISQGPPLIIDGVAHWLASSQYINSEEGYDGHDDDDGNIDELWKGMVILSFDFVQERFDVVEAPPKYSDYLAVPKPSNLRGELSLVYWEKKSHGRCDVYSRQEGIWMKKLGFMLVRRVHPVFWAEDMEERCRALFQVDGCLVFNDTKDGRFVLKSGIKKGYITDMAYDFVETLLFPRG